MSSQASQTRFLSAALEYDGSANYITDPDTIPEIAHVLRAAWDAGVAGAYVFNTAPPSEAAFGPRPAVYIATADDEAGAREIRRKVWNQGVVPFVLVVLPHQVRVYSGFVYDSGIKDDSLLSVPHQHPDELRHVLADFLASNIDSGAIWKQATVHRPEGRVDRHLLRNLRALGAYLVEERQRPPELIHSLIGKYIYIRYLHDRGILHEEWLAEQRIDMEAVLGRGARLEGLRKLVDALEIRFRGNIFPLQLDDLDGDLEEDVSIVAAVISGFDVEKQQLALDFGVYDFSYIPVELLSSIYEQFLNVKGSGADSGAYYTPEPLADFVLAEIHSAQALSPGMRILDPCCGSGIFLVLAFRRLVEAAARSHRPRERLEPQEIRSLMEESIFGVERHREACYVAEFSLILALLSYLDPPDLHHNKHFEFPQLHNRNIFECDFFDRDSLFAQKDMGFDIVVGNPPWVELKSTSANAELLSWITENRGRYPMARFRASEAFLWRATEVVAEGGAVGFLVHATSLTNPSSAEFRRAFFRRNDVERITNFSNLAYELFAGSAQSPAASIVFRPTSEPGSSGVILHYGPFAANQILTRDSPRSRLWAITIVESEIATVSVEEAREGDGKTWKLAMWGTYRDKRTLDRFNSRFRSTLQDLAYEHEWTLTLGLQLRDGEDPGGGREPLTHLEALEGQEMLDHHHARRLGCRFAVPPEALESIPQRLCYVRKGRSKGLAFLKAPHVWIDVGIAAFSDKDFVLQHPLIGLAGPPNSEAHLRALALYLNSSLALYIQFFQTASWGVDRRRINMKEIARLPVPRLTSDQIGELARVQRELEAIERETATQVPLRSYNRDHQSTVDAAVVEVLGIPAVEAAQVQDFLRFRLSLDKGKTQSVATKAPERGLLEGYARVLRDELDEFAGISHKVTIIRGSDVIACEVIPTRGTEPTEPLFLDHPAAKERYRSLLGAATERHSQWAYIQRGLRMFDGQRFVICKSPRSIDWTATEAMHDSDDIIAEVIDQVGIA